MGLILTTNIGSGLGLAGYLGNVGPFTAVDYSSSTYIFYNGTVNSFGATVMTTAAHPSSTQIIYSDVAYLGHQIVVAEFNSFSFAVDARLTGTVGGLPVGEVLVNLHNNPAGIAALFAENDTLGGNIGNDVLEGYGGADWLTGDAGDDILIGDASNDTLFGGFGQDLLFGGDGDDQLYGGFGADLIDGGIGLDTARFRDSGAAVTVSLLTGSVTGGEATGDTLASIENVEGSAYDDALTGDAGANTLTGDAGNDVLIGNGRNDVLVGGAGRDLLDGGDGADTARYDGSAAVAVNLTKGTTRGGDAQGDTLVSIENLSGGGGDDTLTGSTAANALSGGFGNDTLSGLAGNDLLEAGSGFDTMTGGAGRDTFKMTSLPQSFGNDVITDYRDGVDTISFVGSAIHDFSQLTIHDGSGTTSPNSAIVETAFGDLFLTGVDFSVLDPSDFLFDLAAPAVTHGDRVDPPNWTLGAHVALA